MADADLVRKGKSWRKPSSEAHQGMRYFFVCLVFFVATVPAYQASGSATISVSATVPFRDEFAAAVAKNSTISASDPLTFVNQAEKLEVLLSNGETSLKNQSFACEIVNDAGAVAYSLTGNSGKDGVGELLFPASDEMIGKNSLQCQVTGYERPITIEQKSSFFVLPGADDALEFFSK